MAVLLRKVGFGVWLDGIWGCRVLRRLRFFYQRRSADSMVIGDRNGRLGEWNMLHFWPLLSVCTPYIKFRYELYLVTLTFLRTFVKFHILYPFNQTHLVHQRKGKSMISQYCCCLWLVIASLEFLVSVYVLQNISSSIWLFWVYYANLFDHKNGLQFLWYSTKIKIP